MNDPHDDYIEEWLQEEPMPTSSFEKAFLEFDEKFPELDGDYPGIEQGGEF